MCVSACRSHGLRYLGCPFGRKGVQSPQFFGGLPMNLVVLLQRSLVALTACLACAVFAVAADDPTPSKDQIKQFLTNAKVVGSKQASKGITGTMRLTLSDGTLTHDASFQSIDEHKPMKQLAQGTEMNFVDSYKYNIAAFELAELIGLDDIVPVYVERKWKGDVGSLSWWLPVKMDEVERHKQNL